MLLRLTAGIEPMWESIPISLVSGRRSETVIVACGQTPFLAPGLYMHFSRHESTTMSIDIQSTPRAW